MTHRLALSAVALSAGLALSAGCLSDAPEGLADAAPAHTTVAFDWFDKPLPTIPMPNDVATRYDATSPTLRRLNASIIAPTFMESKTRELFDQLDGWGVFAPITIPFTGPIDVASLRAGHCAFDADDATKTHCKFENDRTDDVIYLVDVDPDSPDLGKVFPLDVGHGHYPLVAEKLDYWGGDSRGETLSIYFDEVDEDVNDNGRLDPGEDTDLDGVLDLPNYLPGHDPEWTDLRARADALMTFYERETHTVIVRPLMPLRERTTYAVVVTKRLLDEAGDPVGSPFPWVNHASQTEALQPLLDHMPAGTTKDDIAFAFSFTTQSVESEWKAVRDGLYGHGVQGHLGRDFPAEIAELYVVRPGEANPYVVYSEEWFDALQLIQSAFFDGDDSKLEIQDLYESQQYIDYHVIGVIKSPQLFRRVDDDGVELSLNEQSWPNTLDAEPAEAVSDDVYFWLTMPRKEVSARGDGQPASIAILGHGYGSQRFEALQFGGFFAKQGIATLAIDCVSHGIGLNPNEADLAQQILEGLGLGDFMAAMLTDRAFDQNGDGVKDSGADFWTSYLFHTRDVVRQSALDYMQLVRVFETFDGQRTWAFDTDGDGTGDLAGDFDGDGVVDVGVGSKWAMTGGSLGGIMATVVGGIEPHIDAIAPIAGGGGLGDIGARSQQGGVREAVILRIMGPVYIGQLQGDTGTLQLQTIVPDLNDDAQPIIGAIEGAQIGDTLIAKNLRNGVQTCSLVSPSGTARVHLESDQGDPTVLELYRGMAVEAGGDCVLRGDAELVGTLDAFGLDVVYQQTTHAAGAPLEALAEGMGRYRARPGMRRMLLLGQVALDRADPAVHAEFMAARPITYPGTGETTGTHALMITTMGDMNVPASSGINMARAGGLIDFENVDERYGETPNQVLIDTGAYEAVDTISRYSDTSGKPVHIDLEDFAQANDPWYDTVPRLDPPLRLAAQDTLCDDDGCGYSGALFPYPQPGGQHGFAFPGAFIDRARRDCANACAEDDCGCDDLVVFDIGRFMFNMLGEYMRTGGKVLSFDACHATNDCPDLAAPPEWRSVSDLR